jgi:hypothetical protein
MYAVANGTTQETVRLRASGRIIASKPKEDNSALSIVVKENDIKAELGADVQAAYLYSKQYLTRRWAFLTMELSSSSNSIRPALIRKRTRVYIDGSSLERECEYHPYS